MQSDPKRGRPATVDREHVCEVALRLFEKKGFDQVSMDEIADAAKVSRRTLFRLFPSKAELVWDGLTGVLQDVRERSAQLKKSRVTLDALIEEMLRPTFRWLAEPKIAKLSRRRLRLIAKSPALLNHQALELLRQAIAQAVANTAGVDAPPDLVASSLVAVGFASILWWANQDKKVTALEAFDTALAALRSY